MKKQGNTRFCAALGLAVSLSLTTGTVFASEVDKDAVVLDEVKVESSALEKYLVTTQVITAADIEAKEAKTLPDVLRDVPGLIVSTGTSKGNTTVSIRGSDRDQARIYVDGVLINALSGVSTSSSLDISLIPLDHVAKIEIIKGPGPVQYGTDYKGGVIVITTKDGKGFAGTRVRLSAGTHDKFNASIAMAGTEEKGHLDYYLDIGGDYFNGWQDNMERNTRYADAHLKWDLGKDRKLTLDGGYSLTNKQGMNQADPATGEFLPTNVSWAYPRGTKSATTRDWQYKDWEKTNLSLTYQQKVNPVFDYTVRLFRVTDNNELWVYRSNTAYLDWYKSKWESTMKGAEVQTNWKLSEKNALLFGARYANTSWDEWDSMYKTWGNSRDTRQGYYLQDTLTPGKNTMITLGVRYDKDRPESDGDSKDSTAVDPVFNIVQHMGTKDTMRFSVGRMHLFPTLSQLYGSTGGNSSLTPERGTNYELGWKHEFDPKSSMDAAVFYTDISDRIYTPNKKSVPYQNISSTKIKGVELQGERKFTNKLKGFVNYTWLQAVDENGSGKTDAAGIPKNTFNYGLTFAENKYEITLEGHAFSQRPVLGDSSYSCVPGYYTMDLQYKWMENKNQTYYIRLNNLLNKKYREELYYPAEGFHVLVGADFLL